jgi:hypothetical protein
MATRIHWVCWAAFFALLAAVPAPAAAQGYDGYPYSIMTPERGLSAHRHGHAAIHRPHSRVSHELVTPLARRYPSRNAVAVRGSSGSVLPTPLPRTPLIPPEGGGMPAIHALPQEQGPTIIPGLNPIPNLPHGSETFQDRAARCAHQGALYGVPNSANSQYMNACAM